ncbi:MAG: glycosyltransferase family 87 protein [Dehalococcoidia bacterium]
MQAEPAAPPSPSPELPQDWRRFLQSLALAAQIALVVASLILLVRWLPDTLGRWDNEEDSDFPNFNGAAVLVREGHGDKLYDEDVLPNDLEYCRGRFEGEGEFSAGGGPHNACRALAANFRSPPSILLVYLPLSLLPGKAPYIVSFLFCVAGALALAAYPTRYLAAPLPRLAFFLAVLSLPIVHFAVRFSQPSMLYALALLAGFVLQRRGNHVAAAVAFSVLGFKPQFLVLPLALLAYWRDWKTVGWTVGIVVAALLAGFVIVGPDAAVNYVEFNLKLLQGGPDSPFVRPGWVFQQNLMYNWDGFLRALTGEGQSLIARLLTLSTLLFLVNAWARERNFAPAATVAVSLLATPYVLFYDWTIAAAALALFFFLIKDPRQRLLGGGLAIGVWVAIWVTHKSIPVFGGDDALPDGSIYWATLALAGALLVAGVALWPREKNFAAGPARR